MRSRVRLCPALGLAVGFVMMLAPVAMAQGPTTTVYSSAVTGTLSPVRADGPAAQLASPSASSTRGRGVRRIPHGSSAAALPATAPPQAAAHTLI
jgi:hypothetical protein